MFSRTFLSNFELVRFTIKDDKFLNIIGPVNDNDDVINFVLFLFCSRSIIFCPLSRKYRKCQFTSFEAIQ